MSETKNCHDCGGSGTTTSTVTKESVCETCHGHGIMPATWPGKSEVVCNACNGTGQATSHTTEERVCRTCNGVGEIRH